MMFITSTTPPDVANAHIRAWQRTKEQAFFAQLERLILRAHRKGLGRKRIVRALSLSANALEKAGRS